MMKQKPFKYDISGKKFLSNKLKMKNSKQKLRHQVVEVEGIQELALPHPLLKPEQLW